MVNKSVTKSMMFEQANIIRSIQPRQYIPHVDQYPDSSNMVNKISPQKTNSSNPQPLQMLKAETERESKGCRERKRRHKEVNDS